MTATNHFDLIVIGSGAAGSACWLRARQLGKHVAVFESGVLGGECPTFACVPTKALLHCAEVYETVRSAARFGVTSNAVSFDYAKVKAWKDEVISQTGASLGEKLYSDMSVELVRAAARFVSPNEVDAGGRRFSADKFLIATGSSQRVPPVPSLAEAGYITFKEAIDLTAVPPSLLVLGGGPAACEFAQLFTAFGAKVTVVERNRRLVHREDLEVGKFLESHFRARGVDLRLGADLVRVAPLDRQKAVTLKAGNHEESLLFDEILVATGKSPNMDLGLDAAGIAFSDAGVSVDSNLRTTNVDVFAAGDVVGPHRFTHAASYQGRVACNNIFEEELMAVNYQAMPRCIFTSPEVASVGLTEQEAHAQQIKVRVGFSEISDNDRALTSGHQEGFAKVIADPSGRLLGGVVVSARAAEVAQELALAVALGAKASDVASTIHAFPTFSEALVAACAEI